MTFFFIICIVYHLSSVTLNLLASCATKKNKETNRDTNECAMITQLNELFWAWNMYHIYECVESFNWNASLALAVIKANDFTADVKMVSPIFFVVSFKCVWVSHCEMKKKSELETILLSTQNHHLIECFMFIDGKTDN